MAKTMKTGRAPGLSPGQRREMIIQAALPLVAEFGAAVTTARVARAAGIGEATIFRAFADKDALLAACLDTALDPSTVVRELRSIPLDQPLPARLVEAVDAVRAHYDRIGTVIAALQSTGYRRPRRSDPDPDPDSADRTGGRSRAQATVRDAVAELFAPDAPHLRLPVGTLTDTFLSLLFGRHRAPDAGTAPPVQLVDLFLYGALHDTAPQRRATDPEETP